MAWEQETNAGSLGSVAQKVLPLMALENRGICVWSLNMLGAQKHWHCFLMWVSSRLVLDYLLSHKTSVGPFPPLRPHKSCICFRSLKRAWGQRNGLNSFSRITSLRIMLLYRWVSSSYSIDQHPRKKCLRLRQKKLLTPLTGWAQRKSMLLSSPLCWGGWKDRREERERILIGNFCCPG